MKGNHILMEWHDEAARLEVWGTLDPSHSCMCTGCVLGKPHRPGENIGEARG